MIGFYDYTVILTYISFASSISGIFLATRGHFNWAIFCLAFSGLRYVRWKNCADEEKQDRR